MRYFYFRTTPQQIPEKQNEIFVNIVNTNVATVGYCHYKNAQNYQKCTF